MDVNSRRAKYMEAETAFFFNALLQFTHIQHLLEMGFFCYPRLAVIAFTLNIIVISAFDISWL